MDERVVVDEWASMALAQFDAETRFRSRAERGSAQRGVDLLDKLDRALKRRGTPRIRKTS